MHTGAAATRYLPAERATPVELDAQRRDVAADLMLVAMLESFPEPAVILNPARQIVRANQRLAGLIRRDADSLVGERVGDALACVHAAEAPNGCGTTEHCRVCGAARAIEQAAASERQATQECRISATAEQGPAALDLRVWATPVSVGGAPYLVVAMRDTSDEQRRRVLERLFFHDVLNSAGGLHGLLTLLPEMPEAEAAPLRGEATRISGQIVDEIEAHRDLSAAERGELVARRERLDAGALLADLVTLYAHHPVAEGRRLVLEPVPERVTIESDPILLRRALGNLVKNALEAVAPGERVTVRLGGGGAWRFEVHNPGEMPEAVRLQVFQRSFSTKGGRGRGVGTYSARLIVERCLGGTTGFSSTQAAGTTFWIVLPSSVAGRP